MHGRTSVRNQDIAGDLAKLASRVNYTWIREAIAFTDELIGLQRRNVQKGPSLDQGIIRLRHVQMRLSSPRLKPRSETTVER